MRLRFPLSPLGSPTSRLASSPPHIPHTFVAEAFLPPLRQEEDFETQDVETQDVETQDVETQDVETQDVETQDVETQDVASQRGKRNRPYKRAYLVWVHIEHKMAKLHIKIIKPHIKIIKPHV